MNEKSKKVLGFVGVMGLAAASFHAGKAYGVGGSLAITGEQLFHIAEPEVMEIARARRKHSYPTLTDIFFEMGIKRSNK